MDLKTPVEELDPLDVLEAKTKAIEIKLFGTGQTPGRFQSTSDTTDVVDALIKSQTIMNSAVSSQEKISKLVKRMEALDAVLDPSYESATLSDAAKIETLLLMSDRLHDASVQLKLLKESAEVLNSNQIRGVLKAEDRLNTLMKTVYDNKIKVEVSTGDVRRLFTDYNRLMNTFTKMFAQMDEIVTALEIASEPKTIID